MKFILVLLIIVWSNFGVNAQENLQLTPEQEKEKASKIQNLLEENGLIGNEFIIQNECKGLSYQTKLMLFDKYQKSSTSPFLLNLILNLGIGSFIQGDTKVGIMIFACQAIGMTAILADQGRQSDYVAGAVVMVGIGTVYGWIAPFIYTKKYNNHLEQAFTLASAEDMKIQPYLAITEEIGSSSDMYKFGINLCY